MMEDKGLAPTVEAVSDTGATPEERSAGKYKALLAGLAALTLAGCGDKPSPRLPPGTVLVRNCQWGERIVRDERQFYFVDANDEVSAIAGNVPLNDICPRND